MAKTRGSQGTNQSGSSSSNGTRTRAQSGSTENHGNRSSARISAAQVYTIIFFIKRIDKLML